MSAPDSKTENGVGYVRKNFWPRVRDYEHTSDLLDLCRRWRDETRNVRIRLRSAFCSHPGLGVVGLTRNL